MAYYDIKVDDKLIDQQVDMFANRAGHYTTADSYDPEKRDVLKGDLRELDENGNTLEGGITESDESLMPAYFDDEEQKEKFKDAKPGDIITFNPTAAYKGGETQVASLLKIDREKVGEHKGDFSFQVTEVSRWEKAEVNEELWQGIYGKDSGIKDEKGFREAIAKGLAEQLQATPTSSSCRMCVHTFSRRLASSSIRTRCSSAFFSPTMRRTSRPRKTSRSSSMRTTRVALTC